MRDEADFDWWYRTVYSGVARTVFLIVHDRGCADEITQDAFRQMLRHWTCLTSSGSRSAAGGSGWRWIMP